MSRSASSRGAGATRSGADATRGAGDVPPPGRLLLRLGTRCNSNCAHCTIADIPPLPERTTDEVVAELERGRTAGCEEVVFLRGEPTIRRDIVTLVRRARELGYDLVQLQTNGRMLVSAKAVKTLMATGVTHFEVSLYGDEAALHDAIAGVEGAFEQTTGGLRNLVAAGAEVLVTVPVIMASFPRLTATTRLVASLGVRRMQLNFTRPVRVEGHWNVGVTARLAMASPAIRGAIDVAHDLGVTATTEAVPFCHLAPHQHPGGDAAEDWSRYVVSDLHLRHDSLTEVRQETRPRVPECEGCRLAATCPRTWGEYLALFGGGELIAVR